MTGDDEASIPISKQADVILAGRRAKPILAAFELDESTVEEVVLVIHELASNIVKHAGEGTITLVPKSSDDYRGIEIHAEDSGPGIGDVDRAIVDGYSTVGSLGSGLGAVDRLMDEFEVVPRPDSHAGTHIVAKRDFQPRARSQKPFPLTFGAATRPRSRGDPNGDAFVIKRWGDNALVGVIDGLGHGQDAHTAAAAAKRYVTGHFDQSLTAIFRGVERVCSRTRGVVMALARFDWTKETISYASVGNISHKVEAPVPLQFVTRRGVLGNDAPEPLIRENEWDPEYALALYSDGVRSLWKWDEFVHLVDEPSSTLAHRLLAELADENDDATVLVVTRGSR
ncbi:ATP-binding protein [Natronosalvus halobius]|uniref:ATP-binding protein n=1 Tax=Natronosalvus halobius TaxID=2953746 RepID=UPI00209EA54E|nr:ATP-binding protein [Natronosalvus halobius]USZ72470.1 ATP-binding protein [Natronosalvus halobius]